MSTISGQRKALALIPKFTGGLSLLGSLFLSFDIIFRYDEGNNSRRRGPQQRKINSIYHRIMLGLSIFDFIASFVNILSTWPTPSDQAGVVFLASGSTATCTAQGFFNEFGNITTPLYSASLCVWYLLYLKYGWKERDCRKIEYLFHVIPIAVGFGMAVVGLPLTLYNNSGYLCWYAPYPAGCSGDGCTRGQMAGIFRWIHYGIVWSAIIFVTYAMSAIYLAVRRQENASSRHNIFSGPGRSKSEAVAKQALLYVCALYITWAFTTATRISQTAFKHNSMVLLLLMCTFFPLQGFWNALIYFRPKHGASRTPGSSAGPSRDTQQRRASKHVSKTALEESWKQNEISGGLRSDDNFANDDETPRRYPKNESRSALVESWKQTAIDGDLASDDKFINDDDEIEGGAQDSHSNWKDDDETK